MLTRVRHFGFCVKNIAQAKSFYCDLLDLKVVEENEVDESYAYKLFNEKIHFKYVKLRPKYRCSICSETEGEMHANLCSVGFGEVKCIDDSIPLIELYEMESAEPRFSHVAFQVEDLEELCSRLKKENIHVTEIIESGRYILCMARDFDGNLIELVEVIKPWM